MPRLQFRRMRLYRTSSGSTGCPRATSTITLMAQRSAPPTMAVSAPMWVGAGRNFTAGQSMTLDYMRAGPYPGSYLSRVFAAPAPVASATFSWAADTPTGTTLGLLVRTGNTPTPDGSWTAFTAVPTSGQAIATGWQYIQYRADFATTVPGTVPVLNQVLIDYEADDVTPPTIVVKSPHRRHRCRPGLGRHGPVQRSAEPVHREHLDAATAGIWSHRGCGGDGQLLRDHRGPVPIRPADPEHHVHGDCRRRHRGHFR